MFESIKKMGFRHMMPEYSLKFKKDFCKKYQVFKLPEYMQIENQDDKTFLISESGTKEVCIEDHHPLNFDEFYQTIQMPGSDGLIFDEDGNIIQRVTFLTNEKEGGSYLCAFYDLVAKDKEAMDNIADFIMENIKKIKEEKDNKD